MQNDLPKLIIVAGPTASGKTSFAIKLAHKLNAELINADSRQVVKGMDIGTNKEPLKATGQNLHGIKQFYIDNTQVKAWMFDLVNPDEQYDLEQFMQQAQTVVSHLHQAGKNALVIGGTGLYLDGLVKGYSLTDVPADHALRTELEQLSVTELFCRLEQTDPQTAAALNESDSKNPVRLIRKIELAGKQVQPPRPIYDCFIAYPHYSRDELFKKIDQRAEQMFADGLVDEVKALIKAGYADSGYLKGIGYAQVMDYLSNRCDLQQAVTDTCSGHRQYATRQITWFEGEGRGYDLHRYDFQTGAVQAAADITNWLNHGN